MNLSYTAFNSACNFSNSSSEQSAACASITAIAARRILCIPSIRSRVFPVSATSVIISFSRKYNLPSNKVWVKFLTDGSAGIIFKLPFSCALVLTVSIFPSIFEMAFLSCSESGTDLSARQTVTLLSSPNFPFIRSSQAIFPRTISGLSAKYLLQGIPSSVCDICTQSGISTVIVSRFFRKRISVVTLSASLKVPAGSRTAPNRSHRSAR